MKTISFNPGTNDEIGFDDFSLVENESNYSVMISCFSFRRLVQFLACGNGINAVKQVILIADSKGIKIKTDMLYVQNIDFDSQKIEILIYK